MKLLNYLIDVAARIGKLRCLMRYAYSRFEGFQCGSYSLDDEVKLALTFVNNGRGGGAVIDVGANRGDWSRKFLLSNTFVSKLLVIEPQSIHIPSLFKLCDDNPRVVVEQVALGAAPANLVLYADCPGSGWASLYKRDLGHVDAEMLPQENVEVVTLDQLAKKHLINHILFLKLDLEGHELEALKGARELLYMKNVDAITFEFGGCNIDSRTYIKDFWSLLVCQYHFSFYRLLPGKRLKRLPSYSEYLEQFNWQNILACAPGITPNWKVLG